MSKQKFSGSGDLCIHPEAVGLTWPRATREDQIRSGVAVIKITGPLEHHASMWFDSYESILCRVEGAMQHEDVTCILLDIDSPGGEVSGLQEAVRKIRAMSVQYKKSITAYADDEAYSAAYALACSADEIFLPEGGGVGSVGVLATLCDRTEMTKAEGLRIEVIRSGTRKAEGHPDLPLDDGVIARVQTRVDSLAKQFFALVSDVRPVNRKELEALQGACVYGQKAVNAGLADGVLSFDQVLASLSDGRLDNGMDSVVSFKPTNRSSGDEKMSAVLQNQVDKALAALTAAKTPSARKAAATAYGKAVAALTEATVKKSYKKKVVEEEEETDDGEPDDGDDGDGEESEESEAAVEDDEDEEKATKGKKAQAGSLLGFVRSITGQSSAASAKQVLASMHEQALANQANTEEIAKLKASAVAKDREALITSMTAAGQLKPAQFDWAKTQSIASLKSYAKATPAMFAPRPAPMQSGDASQEAGEAPSPDGLSKFERKLCAEQGISVESYKKTRDASGGASLPKVN